MQSKRHSAARRLGSEEAGTLKKLRRSDAALLLAS